MIYLIQQRQLNKQSETTGRRCIRSILLQTNRKKNEIAEQEKFTDMASTKQETRTRWASYTNLILGDLCKLYERMIVNLNEEVKFLKDQLVLKDNYFREEIAECNKSRTLGRTYV